MAQILDFISGLLLGGVITIAYYGIIKGEWFHD